MGAIVKVEPQSITWTHRTAPSSECCGTPARRLRPEGQGGRFCDAQRALHLPIIDCIWGQELRAAISEFQNEHKLLANGELDSPTRLALDIR
jgi:hypothetical protein